MNDRSRFLALVFAITFPTLVTLVYFLWLQDAAASVQQSAYGVLKTIQFGFPIAWFAFDRKFFDHLETPPTPRTATSEIAGTVFGLLVITGMFGIYFLLLADSEVANKLVDGVQTKLGGMGLNSFWKFAALGCFYAICHSFLEEYYWRWFVFRGCLRFASLWPAVIVSSLGFMAHHVVVLGVYFGFDSPLTYLFSLAVATGGAVWALLYRFSGRLSVPWLSHLIVDAGIFLLGYLLIKDSF